MPFVLLRIAVLFVGVGLAYLLITGRAPGSAWGIGALGQ